MSDPACDKKVTTPPVTLRSPLTPPPTDKDAPDTTSIRRQIAQHRLCHPTQTIHNVDKKLWDDLQPLLEYHKTHCDYYPSTETLVLRMHTDVHEYFSRYLSQRIIEKLHVISLESGSLESGSLESGSLESLSLESGSLESGSLESLSLEPGSAADFVKGIKDLGSATIYPEDPEFGTHDPDGSFHHVESPYPTVILEIAHSQKGKELRVLADEYLLGSDLEIRVVVGVDIEYKKSKRATFSVFRAEEQGPDNDKVWRVKSTVANEVFRTDDGKRNIDKTSGLRLHLEDFADQETCRRFKDLDRDIFVSCDELYQCLREAEVLTKKWARKKAARKETAHNPRPKKRRRTETPEEQLDDRDEAAFVKDEERVSKRQELDDSSYKESSSDCI